MSSGPGSPFGLEDLQNLHIHTNKKLEVWTQYIQVTSFFPWWLLLFFQENFEALGRFVGKKSGNQDTS